MYLYGKFLFSNLHIGYGEKKKNNFTACKKT